MPGQKGSPRLRGERGPTTFSPGTRGPPTLSKHCPVTGRLRHTGLVTSRAGHLGPRSSGSLERPSPSTFGALAHPPGASPSAGRVINRPFSRGPPPPHWVHFLCCSVLICPCLPRPLDRELLERSVPSPPPCATPEPGAVVPSVDMCLSSLQTPLRAPGHLLGPFVRSFVHSFTHSFIQWNLSGWGLWLPHRG